MRCPSYYEVHEQTKTCSSVDNDLKRITLWSTLATWSLLFNVKKCNVLSFPPRCCHAQFLYSYIPSAQHSAIVKTVHNDPGAVLSSDLAEWCDILNIQWSRHAKFLDYSEVSFPLFTSLGLKRFSTYVWFVFTALLLSHLPSSSQFSYKFLGSRECRGGPPNSF